MLSAKPNTLKRLLCGLLMLVAFSRLPLRAQVAAGGSRVVSYETVALAEHDYVLKQCVLDASGHTTRAFLILPKGFSLEAAATSGTRNLYLLRKVFADSVLLLLTDSLGQVQRQTRQLMPRLGGTAYVRPVLFGLPAGQGFVLTYPTGKASRPVLHLSRLGPDLTVRWRQQLAPKELTYVKQITASDSHVWVILEQYLSLQTRRPQVWNCRLATGETDCNTLLSLNEELDAAVVMPAGLMLLGTVSRQYAPPLSAGQTEPPEWRRDIVRLLAPDGRQGPGLSLTWPAAGRPLYHWRYAYAQPDGSYQLIGETYRPVVNGATVALAMIGGGLAGTVGFGLIPLNHYLNERPTGLVLARLGATGQLGAVQQLSVPEALHATAADSTTRLPAGWNTGFRFRGLSPSHSAVVLNTSCQVLLYSLATGQLLPLTPARKATPTVLAIETDHVTIGWPANPDDARPAVERVRLP